MPLSWDCSAFSQWFWSRRHYPAALSRRQIPGISTGKCGKRWELPLSRCLIRVVENRRSVCGVENPSVLGYCQENFRHERLGIHNPAVCGRRRDFSPCDCLLSSNESDAGRTKAIVLVNTQTNLPLKLEGSDNEQSKERARRTLLGYPDSLWGTRSCHLGSTSPPMHGVQQKTSTGKWGLRQCRSPGACAPLFEFAPQIIQLIEKKSIVLSVSQDWGRLTDCALKVIKALPGPLPFDAWGQLSSFPFFSFLLLFFYSIYFSFFFFIPFILLQLFD